MPWTVRCPSSHSHQPIVPISQCCRIVRHTLLLKKFANAHARYHYRCMLPFVLVVFLSSLGTIHLSKLFSAPAADFFEAANLISVADFDIILLCHSNTVFASIPLTNLTLLQTSPTRRSQCACRTKPKAPLH